MGVENILAIMLAIGSTISFITMQIFIKNLSLLISPQYVINLRSILLLIFNSFLVFGSNQYEPYGQISEEQAKKTKHFRLNIKNKKYFMLMVKRLFWNAVSINCFLSCLKHVHISIANALLNTTPVLQFFVQAFYYKKPINRISLIISIVSFIGVLAILNPISHIKSSEAFNWFLLLPLVAAFSNCLNWIYLHEMRDQFKQTVVLEYAYVTHLITSSLVLQIFGTMQTTTETTDYNIYLDPSFYVDIFFMVLFAYLAHFMRIKATFKVKPSQILAFNYIGMVYSIFIDVIYYKSSFNWTIIIGILLTSVGLLSKLVIDICIKKVQRNITV